MKHKPWLLLILPLAAIPSAGQISVHPVVSATGQATVYVAPDQVKVDATVVTQGKSAQDAAGANATQVAAVVAALTKLLGQGADITTVNYSIGPVYTYPPNAPPVITGYSASLTVETTLGNIAMTGAVIDAAIQAGVTSVGSLQFSLKDPEPSRQQALRAAAVQAGGHATAMAGALGRTVGAIVSLQEGSGANIQPIVLGVQTPGAATSITPGLIQVQATVVLQAQLN